MAHIAKRADHDHYGRDRVLIVHLFYHRKQYLKEIRNMWRVEKSDNVLQLQEAWEQKGKIYMRMELCKLGR